MPITLAPRRTVSVGDVEMLAIDCYVWLDPGELLTGTPTITEVGSADLTISNVAVNTTTIVINSRTAAIGQAVQAKIIGWVADEQYRLRITTSTDATPARTKVFDVIVDAS